MKADDVAWILGVIEEAGVAVRVLRVRDSLELAVESHDDFHRLEDALQAHGFTLAFGHG